MVHSAPHNSEPDNYSGTKIQWRHRALETSRTYFGQVRYQAGGYCGKRVQRDYQLVVIHSGSCEVTVNGATSDLPIGYVGLFLPGQTELFQFSKTKETRHSWCCLRPRNVAPALAKALRKAPQLAPLSPLFERVLAATLELGISSETTSAAVVDHLGLSLFSEYLRCCELSSSKVPMDKPVAKSVHYMEEHFGQDDCLARACANAACSRTALIRKFQTSLGQTPGRYLWQLRTEKGLGMLRNSGLTVAEIAELCGFSNPFHFSRRIRATTGISPREVRRKAWGY